jgi:hypothetical protein
MVTAQPDSASRLAIAAPTRFPAPVTRACFVGLVVSLIPFPI